jgi:hypothetical protein
MKSKIDSPLSKDDIKQGGLRAQAGTVGTAGAGSDKDVIAFTVQTGLRRHVRLQMLRTAQPARKRPNLESLSTSL